MQEWTKLALPSCVDEHCSFSESASLTRSLHTRPSAKIEDNSMPLKKGRMKLKGSILIKIINKPTSVGLFRLKIPLLKEVWFCLITSDRKNVRKLFTIN